MSNSTYKAMEVRLNNAVKAAVNFAAMQNYQQADRYEAEAEAIRKEMAKLDNPLWDAESGKWLDLYPH